MHVILFSRHAEKVREFLGDALLTTLILPGGDRIGLYEPRHVSP